MIARPGGNEGRTGESMNTITILAEALARASRLEILRLDIQYDYDHEIYTGRVVLGYDKNLYSWLVYDISENGTIVMVNGTVGMTEGEGVHE